MEKSDEMTIYRGTFVLSLDFMPFSRKCWMTSLSALSFLIYFFPSFYLLLLKYWGRLHTSISWILTPDTLWNALKILCCRLYYIAVLSNTNDREMCFHHFILLLLNYSYCILQFWLKYLPSSPNRSKREREMWCVERNKNNICKIAIPQMEASTILWADRTETLFGHRSVGQEKRLLTVGGSSAQVTPLLVHSKRSNSFINSDSLPSPPPQGGQSKTRGQERTRVKKMARKPGKYTEISLSALLSL